jgi:hypothetical protein
MRIVIPKRLGFRGAGLGNEVTPWAKAFLAAEATGARSLSPAWGMNARGYRKFFGTSRLDWLWRLALDKLLPSIEFTEADYRATGEEDFGLAFKLWADECGLLQRRHWIVKVGGLWGGRWAYRRAQPFLRAKLSATRYTQENLADMGSRMDPNLPTCVVHLRGGDFAANEGQASLQGKFNVALPYEWYDSALNAVRDAFHDDLNLIIVTNDNSDKAKELIRLSGALTTMHQSNSDISDMLLMSQADLVIPSISSFSILALFLNSNSSYLWPKEHLSPVCGRVDRLGIWAQEEPQQSSGSPTIRLANEGSVSDKCVAFSLGGALPQPFVEGIRAQVARRHRAGDLIYYGSVDGGS